MSNLITRGLSRIKQTLVVRGLLGGIPVTGSNPGSTKYYDEYLGGAVGNQKWLSHTFEINGQKMFDLEHGIVVLGSVQTVMGESLNVFGRKCLKYVFESDVNGHKQFLRNELIEMCGSREHRATESVKLSGQRMTDISLNSNVIGVKVASMNEAYDVTGKRDITSILILTDII